MSITVFGTLNTGQPTLLQLENQKLRCKVGFSGSHGQLTADKPGTKILQNQMPALHQEVEVSFHTIYYKSFKCIYSTDIFFCTSQIKHSSES